MKIRFLLALLIMLNLFRSPAIAATPSTPLPAHGELPELIRNAAADYRLLSPAEKQAKLRAVRHEMKNYRKQKRQHPTEVEDRTVLLAILAILLPPLAVYLKENEITGRFWISLLLTLIFWVPGVFYALLVIFEVI